jgi:hypothetical protein
LDLREVVEDGEDTGAGHCEPPDGHLAGKQERVF